MRFVSYEENVCDIFYAAWSVQKLRQQRGILMLSEVSVCWVQQRKDQANHRLKSKDETAWKRDSNYKGKR